MNRTQHCCAVLIAAALLFSDIALAQRATVTAAATGVYPDGTSFNGIPLSGLRTGIGVMLRSEGAADGFLHVRLIGVSVAGVEQLITVDGKAGSGSRPADSMATFSGTCVVDLGNGTPPLVNIPFVATLKVDASSRGTLALVVGSTTLPGAVIDAGSVRIKPLD